MSQKETVLILGLNSFSGSVTALKLLDAGYKVIGLNRSPEVSHTYRAYAASSNQESLVTYELESNYNAEVIVDLCKNYSIATVINFASQSMVAQSWDTPWDWYETNCVWLSRLSSALIDWGELNKFIHFSTPEIYGSTTGWILEGGRMNPTTPYAISRAAGDLHLLAEHRRKKFPVIITRAANVYGPYQQRYRIIPKALISAATKVGINLHGGGTSERSFIFMQDVANALVNIIENGKSGDTYHISTNRLVSIRQVVEMCYEIYDLNPNDFLNVSKERPGKDQAYQLDSSKLRMELSWKDMVSLEDGIKRTKDWVDDSLKDLLAQPGEYLHKA